jgi:hypothetical protein
VERNTLLSFALLRLLKYRDKLTNNIDPSWRIQWPFKH